MFQNNRCVFCYSVQGPTNAQLFHKLSRCYMFRHYRGILRELVINTLPSYTSISNAAVGILHYHHKYFKCSCWYIVLPSQVFQMQLLVDCITITSISNAAVGILYYHHKYFKCSCWYIVLPTAAAHSTK